METKLSKRSLNILTMKNWSELEKIDMIVQIFILYNMCLSQDSMDYSMDSYNFYIPIKEKHEIKDRKRKKKELMIKVKE